MPVIRTLPEPLKNKIAAGEVIERPASVVKELLENSLDAGSSRVRVEVERGGRKLMRVSDDGSGMDREDALLSIERHATSKLGSEEDLFNIRTLGFRGEALPSIASVSRLRLLTAPRGSKDGVSLRAEGGEVAEVRDAPAVGTTVEVRDLFFNTPARRKFLKRDSTELAHIIEAVTRLAISHPGVGFTLAVDGQETMALPRASGHRERLMQIYGSEFVESLCPLERAAGDMRAEGFVSREENFRQTRSNQMVFINGRPVRDPSVSHAIYSAYGGALPSDRHPPFFLFLEMEPSRVDFNVHPAKREVRFADKEAVYRFVRAAAQDALRKAMPAPPEAASGDFPGAPAAQGTVPPGGTGAGYPLPGPAWSSMVSESLPMGPAFGQGGFFYLGDAFVALCQGEGLTIIDHHAAHERVLYERLLGGVRVESRRLLFPRQVRLSPREYAAVLEHREMLNQMGIEVDDFGRDTVVVRSLPAPMAEADIRGILSDAASRMLEGSSPGQDLRAAVAARIACHSSIRGRKVLGPEELSALLGDLENTSDPGHCPHGRPTRLYFSLDDLRKLFKRK
ncbi:MAG: DNA mismatch repair endonuclease MutL [Thermodesulfovibrionales bacterium]